MPERTDSHSDVWKKWQEAQAEMFKGWMDAWTRMAGGWGQGGERPDGRPEPDASELYRRWMDSVQEMTARFTPPAGGIGPDAYAKMFQAADVYARLHAMWVEMFEAYRKAAGEGGEYDFNAVKEVLEKWSGQYREIVQKVFAPALPPQLQWIAELYDGEIPLLASGLLVHLWSPWYEYGRRMVDRAMSMEKLSPEGTVEAYGAWKKAYEESFGRLLRAPAMGYYREAAEKLRYTVDSLAEFNIVLSEFYAALQGAGARSFEVLQRKLGSLQAEGTAEPMSFRDLYRLWWETSEELYIDLFRTEEFSRLQGQLVDKGMQFRRDFQAYVEEATKELPFPNRSEMDHLYKAVDRLKRDVRALKAEVKELTGAGEEG